MISGKTLKKNTAIIVGSIIALSLLTMNVSYSSFFSVQTQNNVQTISTGTLKVEASVTGAIENTEIMPDTTGSYENITSEDASTRGDGAEVTATNKITLTITNKSDVNAIFGASIKRTSTDPSANDADLGNVIIAIQKTGTGKWIRFGDPESGPLYVPITSLTPEESDPSAYPIIYDTIAKKGDTDTSQSYDIYVWLDKNTPEDEQGKSLNLSLSVKSAPEKGQGDKNSIAAPSSAGN